jgi:diacylglycerol kinase (ATP)
MNNQVIIIVNPFCHQGLGWQRWLSIKENVMTLLPENTTTIVIEKGMKLKEILFSLIANSKENFIISAGGDGSTNYLIDALFQISNIDLDRITLGAIGLGSSNDFLKPNSLLIKGIPIRINYLSSRLAYDIGLVKYKDENNEDKLRYFIVNSSFGVTAQANFNFNNPDKILQFLKTNFTSAAILYAVISTIIRYKNIPCQIYFNGNYHDIEVSNINILKIPYVSGSIHYSQEIEPNDGKFALNIFMNMSKLELLSTLIQLASGKFKNSKKRTSHYITEFNLKAKDPVAFEYDGETIKAKQVSITLLSQKINILTN